MVVNEEPQYWEKELINCTYINELIADWTGVDVPDDKIIERIELFAFNCQGIIPSLVYILEWYN